jgi:Ca2+/Na+ antiporter
MVFGLLGAVIATLVFSYFHTPGTVELWMFGVTAYFVFLAHLFWSAEMDLMNPQYEQYATFSEQSNNPNENKSALLTFVLAFAFAIVIFLLMNEGITKIWIKATVASVALVAFKIFTYFLKIKVYYKEK